MNVFVEKDTLYNVSILKRGLRWFSFKKIINVQCVSLYMYMYKPYFEISSCNPFFHGQRK